MIDIYDNILVGAKSTLEKLISSNLIGNTNSYIKCFVVLLKTINPTVSDRKISKSLPYNKDVLELTDILNTFISLGYSVESRKTNLALLSEAFVPCLFIPENKDDNSSPKVILGKKDDAIYVYDVDKDRVIESKLKHEIGDIWIVDKPDANSVRHLVENKWSRLLIDRFKVIFWQLFLLSATISFLGLAVPLFVMFTYNKVLSAGNIFDLFPFLAGVIISCVLELWLRNIRGKILSWFAARTDYLVGTSVFSHLINIPALYIEKSSVSSQINRIKSFDSIRDFLTSNLFVSMIEAPFIIVLLIAMYLIAGNIVFIPILMILVYALIWLFSRRGIRMKMELSARSSGQRQQMILDTFDSAEYIYIGGLLEVWKGIFNKLSIRSSISRGEFQNNIAALDNISYFIYVISGVMAVFLGVEKVWEHELSSGGLIATMILTWRILSPIQIICTSYPKYEQIRKSIFQIDRLMNIAREDNISANANGHKNLRGKIGFSKVGIRYTKNTDPVFAGLSFEVLPGQLMVIVGNNGTGKSTILSLITGLYRPQVGVISIDDIDIRQINLEDLRDNIAYIPQRTTFFTGTIIENIKIANPLATEDDVVNVLNDIGAMEDIGALEKGVNTILDGKVISSLSEKLMYQLSIARACIKDSSIVLIDELPYSFLNSDAGDKFKKILENYKGVKTVLYVSYREDYINLADKAVLLSKNKSPYIGRPDQVLYMIYNSNGENNEQR